MKNRFPNVRRASWRQRFVAIARHADAMRRAIGAGVGDLPPRRQRLPGARAAVRVRFAALRSH